MTHFEERLNHNGLDDRKPPFSGKKGSLHSRALQPGRGTLPSGSVLERSHQVVGDRREKAPNRKSGLAKVPVPRAGHERERERPPRKMSRIPTEALPREILAVLPPEPYDQLDLAHRINAYAYTQKVSDQRTLRVESRKPRPPCSTPAPSLLSSATSHRSTTKSQDQWSRPKFVL